MLIYLMFLCSWLFWWRKVCDSFGNLLLYLRTGLKLEFKQSQFLKPYIEFNTQRKIEAAKDNDKDGKITN